MRILIVEDDFTSRKFFQKVLAPYGDTEVAVNGQEAVEAFQQAINEGRPYDLVTLDIMMPVMDGTEMASRLRDDPATAHIPIIFLSAIMERRDGGSDGRHATVTFAKPFNAAELLAKVDEMLRQASMAEVPLASSRQSRTG